MPSLCSEWFETTSSPYINRFLQPDTIIPDLSNPQGWNRYGYTKNNPINMIDPDGHDDTPWYMKVAATIFVLDQIRKVATGEKINDGEWEKAANVFFPPEAPGTQLAYQKTVIIGPIGAVSETNLVSSSKGEIQLYSSRPASTALGSPQAGISLSGGHIYGKDFVDHGTSAFGGFSLQAFGALSYGPIGLTGDVWGGIKDTKNPLRNIGKPADIRGSDGGFSFGLSTPLSGGATFLYAEPTSKKWGNIIRPLNSNLGDKVEKSLEKFTHFNLNGPGLFACRVIDFCGR